MVYFTFIKPFCQNKKIKYFRDMGINSNLIVGTHGTNNCTCVICTDLLEQPVMLKPGFINQKVIHFKKF